MSCWAFLGPAGTHTEEALFSLGVAEMEPLACASIGEVFTAVASGACDRGVVPIENSIEGSVNETLDSLAFEHDLHITGEFVRDIHHSLLAAPGIGLGDVTVVASKPEATAQCRGWISKHLPGRPLVAANSTAEAVQRAVAEPGVAAIGTALAADLYGARVLEGAVEDHVGNQTRFVTIGRGLGQRTGRDKTSLALFLHEDKPGALLMILSEFAYGQVNLTKIQSRPTKKQLGEYMFFIDLEGHVDDAEVALALDCLRLKLREVVVLGSYPRAR
jgi:prephenate dehydratase